ncbi:flavonoid 3'-monooxygenase-like [Senna tora]|uniref:Flavonoid 3'-monooxygenase-like n=1 Tax=Senna tora TaxID=362788 RepID=A0A835CER9_9FABA|nr:flavonoid 3'-monooxygenase-like [Senna tora]
MEYYYYYSPLSSLISSCSNIITPLISPYLLSIPILALIIIITTTNIINNLKLKLPPGPKPWPIIGNLHQISRHLPHQSLHKLSQTHGPLMLLHFGSSPVIIASSSLAAKHFLKTHDHIFASRPQTAAGKYTTYNYSNITWAPYGPYWRQGRKIYLTHLFTPKRLQSFHHIRVQERHAFLCRLLEEGNTNSKPVVVRQHLCRFTLSVISRIVLGSREYFGGGGEEGVVGEEEFQEMLDELFELNGVVNVGDWIPWLGFLDLQGYVKRMKALSKRFDGFFEHVFREHRERRRRRRNDGDCVSEDMVDFLLDLVDDPNSLDVNFTYDGVKGFTQDLIAGGTDTSATTVEWAMSELLKQPHLIAKASEELDRVIGRERWVEESDIPNLPYLDAIIKETMRLHPVAVFLAPHLALQDCKVQSYNIKKGTAVFINTWSIGRDPSIWDSPEEFIPERFIGKEIDVRGQSFELLPFGSGRRMCPGYSLGLKMIASSLANLLHGFNWRLPQGVKPQDVDMEEVYGLATVRKFPIVALLEPRLPLHLFTTTTH